MALIVSITEGGSFLMRKHVAFVVVPEHGNVNPTLPLVRELIARGHKVSYATGTKLLPALPDGVVAIATDSPVASLAPEFTEFDAGVFAEIMAGLLAQAEAALPVLRQHFTADPPDVICYDSMTFVGRVLSEQLGIPGVALVPTFASNEHVDAEKMFTGDNFDHTNPKLGEVFGRMMAFAAEQGVAVGPLASEVPPLSLVFVPQEFQVAGDTFDGDDRFVFVGADPAERPGYGTWEPPAGDAPVLFVSLGTTWNARPDFFRDCVTAFADTDWHVVMAVGGRFDVSELGPLPANFEVRPYVPQNTVLEHADMFISHAAMGSVLDALYYGVPLVCVPQMPENAANARQVEDLGLGRLLGRDDRTPEMLRVTVEQLRVDEDVQANVVKMRESVRENWGPGLGADAIEDYLN